MKLSGLDLNLLKVLDALLTGRNVTRARKTIGRSQLAVSSACGVCSATSSWCAVQMVSY